MPTVAESEPLAVRIAAHPDCLGPQCNPPHFAVVINGGVITFPGQYASVITSVCLGERAYGGTFDLVIRPLDKSTCSLPRDATVDHIDIAPSSTCPVPGTIPDADFDGTLNSWNTHTSVEAPGNPTVSEIAPKVGSAGSAALHFGIGNSCNWAYANEIISPPLSMPNLALQVRFTGTAGAATTLSMDGVQMGVLRGSGTEVLGNICLPESSKGMTQDLELVLAADLGIGASLACRPVRQDYVFDDLKFVSDPSCPSRAYLADGGFERTDPAAAWDSTYASDPLVTLTTGAIVDIDTAAANVHSGNRALRMVNNNGCGVSWASTGATIPAALGGGGPVLQFFYKAPSLTNAALTVEVAGASSGHLLAASQYAPAQLCLPPAMAGQFATLKLTLAGNVSGVCASQPAETAWFDDFVMTTSTDCPAQ